MRACKVLKNPSRRTFRRRVLLVLFFMLETYAYAILFWLTCHQGLQSPISHRRGEIAGWAAAAGFPVFRYTQKPGVQFTSLTSPQRDPIRAAE
jgi:hypothetical protein